MSDEPLDDGYWLPAEGLHPDDRASALNEFEARIDETEQHFLGFQANQAHDYSAFSPFLRRQLNNLGDPFTDGNFRINSKVMEVAVLDYYARLWRAVSPHDPANDDSYWGYVLSMGSTEGNLFGLWNARDYLQGKRFVRDEETGKPRSALYYVGPPKPAKDDPRFEPVVFYSEDTHYSIIKMVRVLGIRTFYDLGTTEKYKHLCPLGGSWPAEVPSTGGDAGPGSVDVSKLRTLVEFFASRGHPIIVLLNYGTTFKGAYDDVEAVGTSLMPVFERYGLIDREIGEGVRRSGYWIHVDGALGAAYMPFLRIAAERGQIERNEVGPEFDFSLPWVNSISMSGHKWIGAPWPSGVYMTRCRYQLDVPSDPRYIGAKDTTFAGSRNGFSALLLWDYLARHSYDQQIDKAIASEQLATYAYEQLRLLENWRGEDLWVARTPLALTVRFKQPCKKIVEKYSLSLDALVIDETERFYAHIFAMEHVGKDLIDAFVNDLRVPDAFDLEPAVPHSAVPTVRVPPERRLLRVPRTGRGYHGA